MRGNKISRQEVTDIIHKSGTYAQSNSLLKEDYLKIREGYFVTQPRIDTNGHERKENIA
jgi:hypothetical protein